MRYCDGFAKLRMALEKAIIYKSLCTIYTGTITYLTCQHNIHYMYGNTVHVMIDNRHAVCLIQRYILYVVCMWIIYVRKTYTHTLTLTIRTPDNILIRTIHIYYAIYNFSYKKENYFYCLLIFYYMRQLTEFYWKNIFMCIELEVDGSWYFF